ncbi:hypothetical protein V5799_016304 [Amblyomma americanum]|uniref:Secreted protein n=1 Tax=Amblyomma americanum TaxID=6943 RepID=A0AAQ4F6M4_AMBAM
MLLFLFLYMGTLDTDAQRCLLSMCMGYGVNGLLFMTASVLSNDTASVLPFIFYVSSRRCELRVFFFLQSFGDDRCRKSKSLPDASATPRFSGRIAPEAQQPAHLKRGSGLQETVLC